jgi:hypothetical protein
MKKIKKIRQLEFLLSIHSILAIMMDKILITSKCNQIQLQVQ